MTGDDSLRSFYELAYRPERHAGERHLRTRAEARTQVNNFNRWWHTYSAESGRPLAEFPLSAFDLLAAAHLDAVTLAMAWTVDRARAPATANKLRATVNPLWRMAHERGLVASLPRNRKYRCELEAPTALLPHEKAALLAQCRRVRGEVGGCAACDWWLLLALLLLNSGARITVLRHAPTARLDLSRGELVLPARWNKSRKDQTVHLWPSTRRQIQLCRVVERGLAHLLDDFPYTTGTLTRHYTRLVLEPAGIATDAKHKFHCLRRTVASEVRAAESPEVAQQIMGHSSPAVTVRYFDPRYDAGAPRVPDLLPDPLPPDTTPPLRLVRDEAG